MSGTYEVHVQGLLDDKLAQVDQAIRDIRELRGELQRLRAEAGHLEDGKPSGGRSCGISEGSSSSAGQGGRARARPRAR